RITLSEISESTRIGTRFLKAIEDNNFKTLPGGIFSRSFIRAYAKSVGMDEEQAIAMYQQEYSESTGQPITPLSGELANIDPTQHAPAPSSNVPGKPAWQYVAVGAIAVLVVGLVVLFVVRKWSSTDQGASQMGNAAQNRAAPSPPDHLRVGKAPSDQVAKNPNQAEPAARTPVVEAGAGNSTEVSIPAGSQIVVSLEATTGNSWVSYQVDDGKSVALTLKPGESATLPGAHERIRLSLGNRKTLDININNQNANFPPDTPNFAAQVVISHDNLKTFLQPSPQAN
ncbi:MAG TPA: RodZ domain-containing protein, partial [Blastocatellia bacterium]|nr:RodZ domain-containing protein [Blastocatellia bacterium]